MKVIWEPEDMEGGLVLHKLKDRELFILAYYPTSNDFALVSLADGMVLGASVGSAAGLSVFLNKGDWRLYNRIRTTSTVSQFLLRSET